MTYIIITKRSIKIPGDERSRQYPGHGYPAYEEVVDVFHRYEDVYSFEQKCRQLIKNDILFVAYNAKEIKVTANLEVRIEYD